MVVRQAVSECGPPRHRTPRRRRPVRRSTQRRLEAIIQRRSQLFSKRQRVAPRGKPWSVQAKAVVGRRAQNGRNETSCPEKYCGYFSLEAAMDRAARGCDGSVTYSAVPSRMIASASLDRWTEIDGFAIRLRIHRVSGEPPKQRAPSIHTPSTGRACGRAFGPTVVIQ